MLNWYGNHILVRSSQHMAVTYGRPSLDYGHFAKKVLDYSGISHFQNNSKRYMYLVNVSILFYQLGMCSVALLFVSRNLQKLVYDYTGTDVNIIVFTSCAFVFVTFTNMFTKMKIVSIFAFVSSLFFIGGAGAILFYCFQQPNQWHDVPAYTDFEGTITMIAMVIYSYEGQTMVLPVENKLENPEDFLDNCGVLPTTMLLCTALITAMGFFGFTAFGEDTKSTITLNLPVDYNAVLFLLIIQSLLGHCIALYVVFDMFWAGYRRKMTARYQWAQEYPNALDMTFRIFWVFVTYIMTIVIPKLDLLIPIVGVTSGTMCALIFPPILEALVFWSKWKLEGTLNIKLLRNSMIVLLGLFLMISGLYVNTKALLAVYETGDAYSSPTLTSPNAVPTNFTSGVSRI